MDSDIRSLEYLETLSDGDISMIVATTICGYVAQSSSSFVYAFSDGPAMTVVHRLQDAGFTVDLKYSPEDFDDSCVVTWKDGESVHVRRYSAHKMPRAICIAGLMAHNGRKGSSNASEVQVVCDEGPGEGEVE